MANNQNQPNDTAAPAEDPATLPTPTIKIVPGKPGLPAAGGAVDLVVTLEVDLPPVEVDRKALNLALVIDRSGSMGGQPLEAAKEAAKTAVNMLVPGDYVAVVHFGHDVQVAQPLVQVGADRRAILAAIDAIPLAGNTNLFGGWAEGLSQVMTCPDPNVVSRVVLLSDGMANAGVVDQAAIAADVGAAASHGVTTTSMGLGRHY
ncbi:MAG: VWA domain-containing protein, partial [Trueperaceae bacterium]